MNGDWKSRRQIPQGELQEKLETVRELSKDENETEMYEIVKHAETGEHYLHYAYIHWNVSDGSKESFHQLLPLESDDVLGIVVGGQPYTYPEHWQRSFLRNGPDGTYIWFDPTGILESEADDHDRIAGELSGMLGAWKKEGLHDEESVRKLLEEIERKLGRESE